MKIEFKRVNYIYNQGMPGEIRALEDIDLIIDRPEFIAMIGSTGSGKSTLVQLLNGLLIPDEGQILFDDVNIYDKLAQEENLAGTDNLSEDDDLAVRDKLLHTGGLTEGKRGQNASRKKLSKKAKKKALDGKRKQALREIRKRVGLVFQYPENQLFDETILKDVSFGPKNMGYSAEEAENKAKAALKTVGVPEALFDKSPFELSGGQMRRVAIAGVLAMEPEILVLDEPTAGLDPQGKTEILDCIKRLQKSNDFSDPNTDENSADAGSAGKSRVAKTVIFVSHNMDEVAEYADRVIAMNKGRIIFDKPVKAAFSDRGKLEDIGLKVPEVTDICSKLGISGVIRLEEAVEKIKEKYKQ